MPLPLVVLNGPTASGKSSLAIQVALQLGEAGHPSEIVNADSMLVYRGMDIGTAKPTVDELAQVPHHLVDIMDVDQAASVADFQQLARRTIADLRSRGVVPVLVGGSALYVHAILDEFSFPGTDPAVRARWERRLAEVGPEALHAELAARDAAVAAGILPGNGRRIVRALEVLELTGGFTPQLPQWSYALPDVLQFGLQLDRERMDRRIDERVDQMWADGLVAEVRALAEHGLREGLTASRALGYRQVLQFLDGELTEHEARERTKSGTRRFARKQLAWFRRDPRITWLEAGQPENPRVVVDQARRAMASSVAP
ncbi:MULTISPECIES: tRNA (adenosine(37)-N6)-dimethylallyltransferase MiaA [unclassified Luteococcus]|uniref:tRNA (adenosine(37)-N6)-dimethylallyltransferase MiaA n=1 Tax=unclassified Luteococcus TaxID=2639923 RepID=UPI00313E1106